MKARLEIEVNGKMSEETFAEILGNIIEHVENENRFWQVESMLDEHQHVSATLIGSKKKK